MGFAEKTTLPPPVVVSNSIAKIIEAMSVKDKRKAKLLFEEALKLIYEDCNIEITDIVKQSIDGSFALIHSINPQDIEEKIYVAQVVLGNILGMHKLSQPYPQDQNIALKLLKVSNNALQNVYQKRCGNQYSNSK